jgi:1-acyl-sn-glycerol-3-phosphate acyltransferase
MKPPPPRIVRRLVVAPLAVLVCLALTALSAFLLLGALLVDAVRRTGWGTARFLAFAVVYLAIETAMIVALLLLWLGSLFGLLMQKNAMQSVHYALMRTWLRCLSRSAISLLGLRIAVVDSPEPRPGPVLVFGRHAGAGNSLMLIRTLMIKYGRTPRVVMLAFLQWDPVIDIVAHRVPSLFIDHDPRHSDRFVDAIAALARGMRPMDAFVLYPEGRDFNERLRLRAIAHLRKEGHLDAAEQAEAMDRVLPPRHRGPLAAILAAPEADVVLFAHTALEEVGPFRTLHRRVPLSKPIQAQYWRIPASEVPHERDELIAWLFDWWRRIDAWIDEHATAQ